ncbi:hypothetical protein LINGRAHAP2_LOCUS2889, partial [Linum grandiflorum]
FHFIPYAYSHRSEVTYQSQSCLLLPPINLPKSLAPNSKMADEESELAATSTAEATDLQHHPQTAADDNNRLISSYLGLSFSVFLALLPANAVTLLPALQSRIRDLSLRLFQAEEQLKQMKSRRQEDSKANARVVEIFAGNRNAWRAEEKRLLQQIDAASEESAVLRARIRDLEKEKEEWGVRVHDLEREVGEREEMLGFMSRSAAGGNGAGGYYEEDDGRLEEGGEDAFGDNRQWFASEDAYLNGNGNENFVYGGSLHHQQQQQQELRYGGLGSEFAASASKFWPEGANNLWQQVLIRNF